MINLIIKSIIIIGFVIPAAYYFILQNNEVEQSSKPLANITSPVNPNLDLWNKLSQNAEKTMQFNSEKALQSYLEAYPLPDSLADVDVDGEIVFSALGELQQSDKLRSVFDQLLSLENEWDYHTIRVWLQGYADIASQSLSEPALGVDQVMASFDIYVDYLKSATEMIPGLGHNDENVLTQIKNTMEALHQLRVDSFGSDTAHSYFSREESYDDSQYLRALIYADQSLTTEQKGLELAKWSANLGNLSQREHVIEHEKFQTLRKNVEQLKQQGANSTELFAVREQAYGYDSAARLANLDLKKAQWQDRVYNYRVHYRLLQDNIQLQPIEIKSVMGRYIAKNFSVTEQKRLPSLSQ